MRNAVPVELPCACVVLNEPALRVKVADVLTRYGYAVAGPFDRWSDAAGFVGTGGPDAAVLDFSGREAECLKLARRLISAGVPTVFYAAAEELKGIPVDLKGVPFVPKPDREFLVPKRLSTLHNERLMRRLLGLET
jgi:hypothetical protein